MLYAVLFAPAVVTYGTSFPFLHGKVFWIEIFIEVTFSLYLILISINKKYLPKKTPIFWAVSVFIGALTLSTIFSVDRTISFWGEWSRMTGLSLYLHLFAFFVIFSSTIQLEKERRAYLIFMSLLGTGLSFIGWLQRWKIPVLRAAWVGSRVGSTMDNPIFFAVFLIFIVFFSFYLTMTSVGYKRFIFLFIGLFNLSAIYLTGTRGALLGVIIGLVASALLKALSSSLKWKASLLGVLIILSTLLLINPFRNFLFSLPGSKRFTEATFNDATLQTRLITWGTALKGFIDRPVLGWGHETFFAVFNKFYNPKIASFSLSETWFDKPHNMFLELLSQSGVLGLGSFIGIFFILFLIFFKNRQKLKNSIYALIFLVASYFITIFFEFDMPPSLLLLFFSFAFFNSLILENKPDSKNNVVHNKGESSLPGPAMIFFVAVFTVILLWFIPIKSFSASSKVDDLALAVDKNFVNGLEGYNNFIKSNARYSEEVLLEYSGHLLNFFSSDEKSLINNHEWFDTALLKLEEAIKKHPYDARYFLSYGVLANALAISDSGPAKKAEEVLDDLRNKLSPDRPQVLLLLAETKILLDKNNEAIDLIKRAQELTPNSKDITYRLAIAYFAAGFESEGFRELDKARLLGMEEIGAQPILVLISVNASRGNWHKVAELYEEAIKLEPQNAKLYAQMAVAYATIGNKQKAKEAVLKAVKLDPKLKAEGELFLNQLK